VLLLRSSWRSIAKFEKPHRIVRNPYLESKPPVRKQVCPPPDYPETQIAENNLQSQKMEVDNAERHNEEEHERTGASIEYPETQIVENNLLSQKTEVEDAERHNEEEHVRIQSLLLNSIQDC
jgi:hypothetical protein